MPMFGEAPSARPAFDPVGSRTVARRLAQEGPLQDRLPQGIGSLQVRVDLGFNLANDGEAAVDFGDDSALLDEGRKRYR